MAPKMSHRIMEAPTLGTHSEWWRSRERLLHILERTWRDSSGYLTLPLGLHEDDPRVSFGRPTIVRKGVSTEALVGRIDAGEPVDDMARDYDLTRDEIEAAVLYERAA